ncbi:hypothetical protein ACQQ91_06130 [Selenomonas bovis]|uniref:hypothetical protein n=1 Tax=Selenomonas bovis TaxID=416586 RepID=UPI003CFC7250
MANIIVGLIVLACLAVAARHIYKLFQGETSCCGGSTAPKVPAKKLTGPIVGEKLVKIDGMTCANCKTASSCCSTASTAPPLRSICTGAARRSG